jgi:ornithine cyclodeaminase/alanine dehydrogenase
MTHPEGTLILTRQEIAPLLTLGDYIALVEDAFGARGRGDAFGDGLLHGDTPFDMEFHIKAGGLEMATRSYYGLKINSSSFVNMKTFGLPNIQGAIILFDARNGFPLAVVDSGVPTINRTGAATAVAAKYLARKSSRVLMMCGCGLQGGIQARSVAEVLPIERVLAHDTASEVAREYAREMSGKLEVPVEPAEDLAEAAQRADVIVCCTPARSPYLGGDHVKPGTFVAAVGSDSPDKQELDAGLLAASKVVVDILAQAKNAGELHHALEQRLVTEADVHAELGDIVAGKRPGRENDREITVFDSTGTALQDVAAAAACYEKAAERGIGRIVKLRG